MKSRRLNEKFYTSLRLISLFYFYIHFTLQFEDLFSIKTASILLMTMIIFYFTLKQLPLKFYISLILLVISYFLITLTYHTIFYFFDIIFSSVPLNIFLFELDISAKFLIPILSILLILIFIAEKFKKFRFYEVLILNIFIVLLFSNQNQFNISLYPHSFWYMLSISLFFLIQLFSLFMAYSTNHIVGKQSKKQLIIVIIPSLFILMIFLLFNYNKASVQSNSGLLETTLFQFDFSQYVQLQSEIKTSDDLVLLFRKDGTSDRYLIRRFVLSAYSTEKGFYYKPGEIEVDNTLYLPNSRTNLTTPDFLRREPLKQSYFLINLKSDSILAMNYPVEIIPYKNWDNSSFSRVYEVNSMISNSKFFQLAQASAPEPGEISPDYYDKTDIPESIMNLSSEITENSIGYYEKIDAIFDYLKSNYKYSLKPGIAETGSQLEHFLFNSKKGYCSYFAFAMALMCRAQDIPARVSVGFFANPEYQVLNFYPIKANMAHAWVEIYFEDYGWIEFDPTSTEIADGEIYNFGQTASEEVEDYISEIIANIDSLTEEEKKTLLTTDEKGQGNFSWNNVITFVKNNVYVLLASIYIFSTTLIHFRYKIFILITKKQRTQVFFLKKHLFLQLNLLNFYPYRTESTEDFSNRISLLLHLKTLASFIQYYQKSQFSKEFSNKDFNISKNYYKQSINEISSFKKLNNFYLFHPLKVLGSLR